jgi:hypothetical protein
MWMLRSLRHLADEEVVRRTTPALKGGAVLFETLGQIATDAALMELLTITARTERQAYYHYRAHERMLEGVIRQAAYREGTTVDELEDRFVPTCDVDAQGGVDLDFGARTFRVGFDSQLQPYVTDEGGERRAQLPRGAKQDDPEKVQAANQLWADLREDVKVVVAWRSRALGQAMVVGRRWTPEAFRRVWVDHPLMALLAQSVVWEALQDGAEAGLRFRMAEDRTFADVDDESVDPFEGAPALRVANPAQMEASEVERWRETFADYELISLFGQLRWVSPTLSKAELASSLARHPCPLDETALGTRLRGFGFINQQSPARRNALAWAFAFDDAYARVVKPRNEEIVELELYDIDGEAPTFADVSQVTRANLFNAALDPLSRAIGAD